MCFASPFVCLKGLSMPHEWHRRGLGDEIFQLFCGKWNRIVGRE